MSIRRKGDIPSRRLNETIELFAIEKQFDGFVSKGALVSLGEFAADIEPMKGGRFAYYQSLGYSHPMVIRLRNPEIVFQAVRVGGREVVIKNQTPDPENSNYIILTTDYTSGKV